MIEVRNLNLDEKGRLREGTNESKIKLFFFLIWKITVQDNNNLNVLGDNSIWLSEITDSNHKRWEIESGNTHIVSVLLAK